MQTPAIHNEPSSNMILLTYVIYGLHLFGAVTGLITSAAIVTAFLTGWPTVLAVVLNYIKRSDSRGTYLESHFSWQIRTFWFAVMWLLIAGLLFLTIVGIPFAWGIFVLLGVWILYRMLRGVMRLLSEQPMPMK